MAEVSSMPTLPQDIHLRIVEQALPEIGPLPEDYAYTKGSIALCKKVCLVSKEWLAIGRQFLYQTVHLATFDQVDAFSAAMKMHPHLAEMVRNLFVYPPVPSRCMATDRSGMPMPAEIGSRFEWLQDRFVRAPRGVLMPYRLNLDPIQWQQSNELNLVDLLKIVPNIRRLYIVGPGLQEIADAVLAAPFDKVLQQLCVFPEGRKPGVLSLVPSFVDSLGRLPALRHLVIERWPLPREEDGEGEEKEDAKEGEPKTAQMDGQRGGCLSTIDLNVSHVISEDQFPTLPNSLTTLRLEMREIGVLDLSASALLQAVERVTSFALVIDKKTKTEPANGMQVIKNLLQHVKEATLLELAGPLDISIFDAIPPSVDTLILSNMFYVNHNPTDQLLHHPQQLINYLEQGPLPATHLRNLEWRCSTANFRLMSDEDSADLPKILKPYRKAGWLVEAESSDELEIVFDDDWDRLGQWLGWIDLMQKELPSHAEDTARAQAKIDEQLEMLARHRAQHGKSA